MDRRGPEQQRHAGVRVERHLYLRENCRSIRDRDGAGRRRDRPALRTAVRADHASAPMVLRARVFASAHQPGLADDGSPGDRYVAYHRARARSGFAMQITGATPIVPSNLWDPRRMLVNRDESIVPGYQRLAEAVHEEGGRMLAQLMHPGAGEIGLPDVVSASVHVDEMSRQPARAITPAEMDAVVERYREAADRCRRGDLDGVEIPIAWGYLLGVVRVAADEPPRRRVRRHAREPAAVPAARAAGGARGASGATASSACGWSATSWSRAASRCATRPTVARGLAASGLIDYLNVIAGTNMRRMSRVDHWPATPAGTGIWRHLARAVREAVDIPVCTVGRVNHPDIALDILASGDADLVGLARAHIVDAEFLHEDARRPGRRHPARAAPSTSASTRCCTTSRSAASRTPRSAARAPSTSRTSARAARRSWSAAAQAASRRRGGWRRAASRCGCTSATTRWAARCASGRRRRRGPRCSRLIGWWERDLARRDVDVRLGVEATADAVLADAPAIVVVASRRRAAPPPRAGRSTDRRRVRRRGARRRARRATCWSPTRCGRADAMLLAEALVARGRRVTLATQLPARRRGRGHHDALPAAAAARATRASSCSSVSA